MEPPTRPANETTSAALAILGGPRAMAASPPDWPTHDPLVRQALEQVVADGSWGKYHGRHGVNLASELASLHQVEHVALCCSGTFGVELALRGLRVGQDDEVIMAGYDFPGNFRAVEAVGATPVLVDVDEQDWNLNPELLAAACSDRTRAILVSHLHGVLVSMPEIMALAHSRGLVVVEDACQATGASLGGRRAGTWGDVGVLSFGGSKLLTAGRGGAILTQRADVQQRAKVYCEQGNHAYPLSELQAAVLLPQLRQLDSRNARRTLAVARLYSRLAREPALAPLPNRAHGAQPAFYKLGWRYAAESCQGCSRDEFARAVRAEGVALDAGFRGFALRGSRRCRVIGPLTHSQRAAESALILHHPVLLETDDVIDAVASAIIKVAQACRGGIWPSADDRAERAGDAP